MPDPIKIFIATHVPAEFPKDGGYVPMQVGRKDASVDLGLLGDDTGENISHMNPSYCELTALYWAWKNCDANCIGLVHYSRYLSDSRLRGKDQPARIARSEDIVSAMRHFDLIVPSPLVIFGRSSGRKLSQIEIYEVINGRHHFDLVRASIEHLCPDYLESFDAFSESHVASFFNIMVARSAVIDAYCSWLFPILSALEEVIPHETCDGPRARVLGCLGERLLNVWLGKNAGALRIGYLDCLIRSGDGQGKIADSFLNGKDMRSRFSGPDSREPVAHA